MSGGDWIDDCVEFTSKTPAPEVFRKWAAISAVGAACERRIWTASAGGHLFPTLYVLLVGRPGSGKSQAIRPIEKMWHDTKKLHVAPDSMTKASMLDALNGAKRAFVSASGQIVEYHSLIIPASELGVLIPKYDPEMLSALNKVYDNEDTFGETRRTGGFTIKITNPQINILAGTQPAFLQTLFPEEAWGVGFPSRLTFVYSGDVITPDIFNLTSNPYGATYENLVMRMKKMTEAYGPVQWTPEAQRHLQKWANDGCPPAPMHSRLTHYNSRRFLHIIRMSMISAVSQDRFSNVTLFDVERAMEWLLSTEEKLPEIFKEMVHKSDHSTMQELHLHLWGQYVVDRKPIDESEVYAFLAGRMPAYAHEGVIATMVKAKMLEYDPVGLTFKPVPKNKHAFA